MPKFNVYFTNATGTTQIGERCVVNAGSPTEAITEFLKITTGTGEKYILTSSGLFSAAEVHLNPKFVERNVGHTAAEIDLDSLNAQINVDRDDATQVNKTKKQYKVMTQKDKWFSQKFDPEMLEQALNAYAKQGWVVKSICTASIRGFGSNREELIVVFAK